MGKRTKTTRSSLFSNPRWFSAAVPTLVGAAAFLLITTRNLSSSRRSGFHFALSPSNSLQSARPLWIVENDRREKLDRGLRFDRFEFPNHPASGNPAVCIQRHRCGRSSSPASTTEWEQLISRHNDTGNRNASARNATRGAYLDTGREYTLQCP